jgi:iron complex transport system permease protein
VLYPAQMPAGTIASILGGSYFIYLLTRRRLMKTV